MIADSAVGESGILRLFFPIVAKFLMVLGAEKQMVVAEASSNFDTESLEEFLRKIVPVFDGGFDTSEIRQVVRVVRSRPLDAEQTLSFGVIFEACPETLEVHLFMDDVEAPDVYFRGTTNVIKRIQAKLDKFLGLD